MSMGVSKNPSFKFQLMWTRDPTLKDLMSRWWSRGDPTYGTAMYSFVKRLQFVKSQLNK